MTNTMGPLTAQPLSDGLRTFVDDITPTLVALRRDIHQHPEGSREEHRTTQVVADQLLAADLQPQFLDGTGLICDIGPEGPRLGLRADLDALPIVEENRTDYVSQRPGYSHACGHDVHTTILVGVARVLAQAAQRGELTQGVRCVFQPAEEARRGGALDVIEQNALDGVSQMLALHCDPSVDVGQIGTKVGPITSAADQLSIRLTGHGGHTSRPYLTADVVYALAHLASTLPGVLTRRIDTRGGASLVWGRINAGSAANAIPQSGTLEGTLRCLQRAAWEQCRLLLPGLVNDIVAPFGVDVTIDHHQGVPPVVNDETVITHSLAAGITEFGEDAMITSEQSLGGEDFAWYLEHVPGALLRLGTHTPGSDRLDLHRGDFDVDERCIPIGVRLLTAATLHQARLNRQGALGQ